VGQNGNGVCHKNLHSAAVRQYKTMMKFPCRLRQKWAGPILGGCA